MIFCVALQPVGGGQPCVASIGRKAGVICSGRYSGALDWAEVYGGGVLWISWSVFLCLRSVFCLLYFFIFSGVLMALFYSSFCF